MPTPSTPRSPTVAEKVVNRQDTAATEYTDVSVLDQDRASATSDAPSSSAFEGGDVGDDDEALLSRATLLREEGRLLEAARLLSRVSDPSLIRMCPLHSDTLERARRCEEAVTDMISPVGGDGVGREGEGSDSGPAGKWTKQGECHGRHRSLIYYRIVEEGGGPMRLRVRIETPVEPSLLVPLLSVLNESELYATWLPSWTKPVRLGVSKSDKLRQNGRADQTVLVTGYLPWPLSSREVVIDATAFDDIDANGLIGVKLMTLETGEQMGVLDGGERNETGEAISPDAVPPPARGSVRVDFDGGFLFRQCPKDHPSLHHYNTSTASDEANEKGDEKYKKMECDNDMLLVTFSMYVDAKINFVPASVINFVVRTVIGRMWDMFLQVVEDVKSNESPKHSEAIERKRESLYDWVEERVYEMFQRLRRRSTQPVAFG